MTRIADSSWQIHPSGIDKNWILIKPKKFQRSYVHETDGDGLKLVSPITSLYTLSTNLVGPVQQLFEQPRAHAHMVNYYEISYESAKLTNSKSTFLWSKIYCLNLLVFWHVMNDCDRKDLMCIMHFWFSKKTDLLGRKRKTKAGIEPVSTENDRYSNTSNQARMKYFGMRLNLLVPMSQETTPLNIWFTLAQWLKRMSNADIRRGKHDEPIVFSLFIYLYRCKTKYFYFVTRKIL